jgi:transcriptional regulator with XRE-family HTH domain
MAVKAGKCLLRQRLKEARMTQQELADRLNMSKSQLSQYVNGTRKMSLDTAASIARAIGNGCTIDDLYTWEPVEKE